MSTRAHMYINGRVQGVGFRSYAAKHARQLNLTGFVRNLSNGQVESIVEGTKENIEKYHDYITQGPMFANVTNVNVNWENASGEFPDFRVEF